MYQNFIWDFDGTLFNTYPKMLKAYVKTMQHYQISITPSAIYRTLKIQSSKDLANQYQLDFEEFDQIYKQFEKSDTSNVFAYDDAKYILELFTDPPRKCFCQGVITRFTIRWTVR